MEQQASLIFHYFEELEKEVSNTLDTYKPGLELYVRMLGAHFPKKCYLKDTQKIPLKETKCYERYVLGKKIQNDCEKQ